MGHSLEIIVTFMWGYLRQGWALLNVEPTVIMMALNRSDKLFE